MATFTWTDHVVRTRRYRVPAAQPWGADWGEVCKAVGAAQAEYRRRKGLPEDATLGDDVIRFYPGDDEIIISFTVEEEQR